MIDFTNAKILSLNVENKFFGDSFRYASTKAMTIQGTIYDIANQNGIESIWSGISGIVEGANDYDDILLRGVSFGNGRIDSVRFTEGTDVREKDYSISLTVFATGNLFNMTGSYYSGADFSSGYLLESFSENFDFKVDSDLAYSYEQSVSCRFVSNGGSVNTIPVAQSFARSLMIATLPFGFFTSSYSGFYNEPGRRLYKENYNVITNECSFSESYRLPATSKTGYSIRYDYQVNLDQKGVTSIQEHGSILGLIEPLSGSALSGYGIEIANLFSRCSGEFGQLAASGASPLNTTRISLQTKINPFEGTIDYTATFNNDPILQYGTSYTWDYTQELRKEGCVNQITEKGQIKGLSIYCTYADRYANAVAGYTVVESGISGRATAFASGFGVGPIRQISSSEERSQFQGTISYSAVFNDALVGTSSATIRKIETEISDEMPVALINQFVAFGFGGIEGKEVVQPTNNSTQGIRTATIKVYGIRSTARNILISQAVTSINANVPPQTDPYIIDAGYTFNPTNNILEAKTSWKFNSGIAFTTIDV